jgi:N-acetylmuramic acid 6-phosphate etherase
MIYLFRLIAGGDHAIRYAVEGAEDSVTHSVDDLSAISPPLNPQLDTVIGLTASGRTPYVLSALEHARTLGCFTVGICCVVPSEMRYVAETVIECPVGPEVITGSTRMKSGTAQKMVSLHLNFGNRLGNNSTPKILNMISTGCQVRIGKTYGNLVR